MPDSRCSQCLPTWWLEWQFSVAGWGPPQTHHTGSLSHHIHRRCRGLCRLQEKTPLNTTSFCLGSPGLFVSYRKVWTHTDRADNLLLRDKASQLCPPVLALSFFYNLNLFFFFFDMDIFPSSFPPGRWWWWICVGPSVHLCFLPCSLETNSHHLNRSCLELRKLPLDCEFTSLSIQSSNPMTLASLALLLNKFLKQQTGEAWLFITCWTGNCEVGRVLA